MTHPALQGLTVLERGWLSANNTLIHATPDEAGATVIDTGHVNHAEQTVALVRHALAGQALDRIVNTHLHSDHCGGNAALQRAFGARLVIPPGLADAVTAWDAERLSYAPTGQRIAPYAHQEVLHPGDVLAAGGRRLEAVAAPGHDPHSLMLWDAQHRLLFSADALWEHGFGVVFPELDGEPGFADVAATLDLIESLGAQIVVPGHGEPFTDVAAALARARSRLAAFRAAPERHHRHGVKVLIKYHLMEVGEEPLGHLLAWVAATPLFRAVHVAVAPATSPEAWCLALLDELVAANAVARRSDPTGDPTADKIVDLG